MENLTKNNTEKKIIFYNRKVLDWYFKENKVKQVYNENEKERIFAIFSNAAYEDPFVFMRIVLYIANTRTKDSQEIAYKTILHFLAILLPQFILNNLDLILEFGYKNDVLFLLQAPNLQQRVIKYIESKAKTDDDFKILLDGKLINKNRHRKIFYKPKLNYKNGIVKLLEKILDDPNMNGILV